MLTNSQRNVKFENTRKREYKKRVKKSDFVGRFYLCMATIHQCPAKFLALALPHWGVDSSFPARGSLQGLSSFVASVENDSEKEIYPWKVD